jgi:endonuclease/exonuclease/phosphatase family metal-dependent hydrolase
MRSLFVRMRFTLPAVPALAFALAVSSCARTRESVKSRTEPTTIKVASYNVLYLLAEKSGSEDPTAWVDGPTLDQLEALDVDILLLQETNAAWEAAIRASVGDRFPYCQFHQPGRHAPGGIGLCARRPIVEDRSIDSPLGWFPAQRALVETTAGRIQVLNVHLRPAISKPGQTWWDANAETRSMRVQEMQYYLDGLPKDLPTIVGGDFNEVGGAPLFDVLATSGFDNALTAANVTTSTWRWLERPAELHAQLDHIAYGTRAFRLVEARVDTGGNSDHLPVVVKLETPPP